MIWKIRERLIISKSDKRIWDELQRQLDQKGFVPKKGHIQDTTFIEADQGRKRVQNEKRAKKEGKETSVLTNRKRTWTKTESYAVKGTNVHRVQGSHQVDVEHGLIRSIEPTASQHDNTANLIRKGDGKAYRDWGYFGTSLPEGVEDKTMQRSGCGRKLNGGQQKRNKAISRIRSPGERPFSVMKRTFNSGRPNVNCSALKD